MDVSSIGFLFLSMQFCRWLSPSRQYVGLLTMMTVMLISTTTDHCIMDSASPEGLPHVSTCGSPSATSSSVVPPNLRILQMWHYVATVIDDCSYFLSSTKNPDKNVKKFTQYVSPRQGASARPILKSCPDHLIDLASLVLFITKQARIL